MRKRTYILWKRILTRFFILCCVLGALFIYLRTGLFTIHSYVLTGVPEEYTNEITHGAELIAEQRLYKTLPGNRILSYHDDELRALVMDTLPNTSDITIRPLGLHSLSITPKSHVPLFSVSDTHAISHDGTIYREIIPLATFPRITIATTTEVTASTLAAIATFVKNVDSVLYPVRFIDIDEYNDIRLYDETKKTYVLASLGNDLTKVWSNILSAIDTDPLKKKINTKSEHLEYIDARFGNKVFYKFTNVSTPAIIPETNESTAATTVQ